jgi:hypothetical protein
MEFLGLAAIAPPGAVPIAVPLNLPSQSSPDPGVLPGSVSPASGSGGPPASIVDSGPPQITFVGTDAETSSAEVERIGNQRKEEEPAESLDECTDADILEWFERNPRSVASDLDWGRRAGVGAGPADTDNVFRQGNCYFTSAAGTGDPSLDN